MSKDGIHGFKYEAKLGMLLALRASHYLDGEFSLRSQASGVGQLDDIMLEYEKNRETKCILIQAKHRENQSKKIQKASLLGSSKGDYSLPKYFTSYKTAIKKFSAEESSIANIFICTNVDFGESVKKYMFEKVTVEDNILNVRSEVMSVKGSSVKQHTLYRFKEEVAMDIKRSMDNQIIIAAAKKLVTRCLDGTTIEHNKDPFKYCHKELLAKEIVNVETKRFYGNFIDGKSLSEEAEIVRKTFRQKLMEEAGKKLSFRDINKALAEEDEKKKVVVYKKPIGLEFSAGFGVVEDETRPSVTEYTIDEIKDYLRHLRFAVDQSDEDLDKIIKEEIGKEVETDQIQDAFDKLQLRMQAWSQGKEEGGFFCNEKLKKFFEPLKRELRFDVRDPLWSFTGRDEELKQMHDKLQAKAENAKSQMIALCGLGGVGKSELARKYVSEYRRDYGNNTIWINAETNAALGTSFRRLAQDVLGMSSKNTDGKEKDIKSIVEEVYRYFSIKKSLFVFDNAEKFRTQTADDEGIDKFLPSLHTKGTKPYVIVTSRNQKWPATIQTLSVNVFAGAEAEELIKKFLKTERDEDIKKLADKLQRFPLALQQAIAYIKDKNEDSDNADGEYKITDYLKKYEEHAEKLLDYEFPEDNDSLYTKTTLITWDLTTEYIKTRKNGATAVKFLNVMSYLDPENIQTTMFKPLVNNDNELLGSTVTLLKQYSMVSGIAKAVLSVHRLVQQVTRIKLTELGNEKECLRETLSLFNNKSIDQSNVDHAVSAWSYVDTYGELVKKFSGLPIETMKHLIESRKYAQAVSFGENSLTVFKKNIPEIDASQIAFMMRLLGYALFSQGKYQRALSYYKTIEKKYMDIFPDIHNQLPLTLQRLHKCDAALKAFQKVPCTDQYRALVVKNNMATVLIGLKRLDETLKEFGELLRKKEKIYGPDHRSTLNTLNSIAVVSRKQGSHAEGLKIYEKIYEKMKNILPPKHPDTLNSRYNIGVQLQVTGKHESALEIFYQINHEINLLLPDHPHALQTKTFIFTSLIALNKLQEALETLLECDAKYNENPELLDNYEKETQMSRENMSESILSLAAVLGKIQNVDDMLKRGTNVNAPRGKNGETSLFFAASNGHHEIVDRLLKVKGVEINAVTTDSRLTPLHSAALKGHTKVVDTLLKDRRTHINPKDKGGVTPLFYAAGNGHSEVIDILMKIGGTFEAAVIDCGATPLHAAALNGHAKAVRTLLTYPGVNASLEDTLGCTPLHWAAENNHPEIVNILLDKGAKVNAVIRAGSHAGQTPLYLATTNSHLGVVKILLDNGADVNLRYGPNLTALHNAAYDGKLDILEALLEKGADVYAVTTDYGTIPLHFAACKGHLACVCALLTKCTDIDFKNGAGFTSLYYAAQGGHSEIVDILLDKGADVNAMTNNGLAPLFIAASKGHVGIVSALLNRGANIEAVNISPILSPKIVSILKSTLNMFITILEGSATEDVKLVKLKDYIKDGGILGATNKDGFTILHYAVNNNYNKIVKFLLERGVDATTVTKNKGNTLLHLVAQKGFDDIAETLLNHVSTKSPDKLSAFVNAKTIAKGTTALDVARKKEHNKIVDILLRYGAQPNAENFQCETSSNLAESLSTLNMFITILEGSATEDVKLVKLKDYMEDGGILGATNKDGFTILHYAVDNNYIKIVKFLLKRGADATAVTKNKGNTSLHLVAQKGFDDIAETLLNHVSTKSPDKLSAFVNAKTIAKGTTALDVARKKEHNKIVNILLRYGAQPNAENFQCETSSNLAESLSNLKISEETSSNLSESLSHLKISEE